MINLFRTINQFLEIFKNYIINEKNIFTDKEFLSFLLSLDITKEYLNENVITLQKIENLLNEIKEKKRTKLVCKLIENIEGLKFLLSISTKDCINIQEFAGEVFGGNNQNFLSLQDLRFIENLVEMFEKIKSKHSKSMGNIIIYVGKKLEKEEDKIIKFLDNYKDYKQFFNEQLNQSKYYSEMIEKILNKS